MTERIGIVYPWPYLDSVPSLYNAAELLGAAGYKVDIYTRCDSTCVVPSFDGGSIEIILLRNRRERRGSSRAIPGRWSYPFDVWRRHKRGKYRCFIGVDPEGLLQAASLTRFIEVPLVYYSLELLLSGEVSNAQEEQLKKREFTLSRKAPFVMLAGSAG